MVRIFPFLLFVSLSLFGSCQESPRTCKAAVESQQLIQADGSLRIPLSDQRTLIYTPGSPKQPTAVANPFLGLYIVSGEKTPGRRFDTAATDPFRLIAIDGEMALPGRIFTAQNGLNELARFEHPLGDAGILCDSCCALAGIVTERGIISADYLRHTLASRGPEVAYGDLGIRFERHGRDVEVESVDPFFGFNPFEAGDRIVSFEGGAVRSAEALERKILFTAPGKQVRMQILRHGQPKTFDITLRPRLGGGLRSDTFLERRGVFFDGALEVNAATPQARALGIAVGDRLLQVNSEMVGFDDEVRRALGMQESRASLLFERGGFQFFVQLPFHDLQALQ